MHKQQGFGMSCCCCYCFIVCCADHDALGQEQIEVEMLFELRRDYIVLLVSNRLRTAATFQHGVLVVTFKMRLQVDHIVVGRFQVMVEIRQHPDLLLHDPVRVRRCVQAILLIDIEL